MDRGGRQVQGRGITGNWVCGKRAFPSLREASNPHPVWTTMEIAASVRPAQVANCRRSLWRRVAQTVNRPQPAHRSLHPPPRRSDASNAGQSPVEEAQRRRIVFTGIAQPVQQRGAIHCGEDRPLGVPTEVRRTIARRTPDRIHRARGARRSQPHVSRRASSARRGGWPQSSAPPQRDGARTGGAAVPGPERRHRLSCGRPGRRTPDMSALPGSCSASSRAMPISASPARSARRVQPSNGTCGSIAAMAASRSALRSTAISVLPAAPRLPAPAPR